jgi:hypothetical protein
VNGLTNGFNRGKNLRASYLFTTRMSSLALSFINNHSYSIRYL